MHETELMLEFDENIADKSVEPSSRFWWIEEIEYEEVLKNVKRLSYEELLIVSMLLEGHSQQSIGAELGMKLYDVSYRVNMGAHRNSFVHPVCLKTITEKAFYILM